MIELPLLDEAGLNHPFVLIHDPDGLLADEAALGELLAEGRRLISETDAIALRARYQEALPLSTTAPLVLIATGPLDELPYDLWQQGHHVHLALHDLFPNLDYPTLRTLSPGQRARLRDVFAAGSAPAQPLGAGQTRDFLLAKVFAAESSALMRPAALLLWLDAYHVQNDPMPAALAEHLVIRLSQVPATEYSQTFAAWPLADMLAGPAAFRDFVRAGWEGYLDQTFAEVRVAYRVGDVPHPLAFAADAELQDAVPRLIRSGTLVPRTVPASEPLPFWILAAVAVDSAGVRRRQVEEGLAGLAEQLQSGAMRWEQWQGVAWRWAQLLLWRFDAELSLPTEVLAGYEAVEADLDRRFLAWIRDGYAPLALRTLPQPHHLFHVPSFLAHCCTPDGRVALVVLDGLALADWMLIGAIWQARHPDWRMNECLLLAQVPSLTAVSRQALVAGRRPADFGASLTHNRREAELWTGFWRSCGYAAGAIAFQHLPDRAGAPYPDILDNRHVRALCLVSPVVDAMIHGSTHGAADLLASLRVWLQAGSFWLEGVIERLLAADYTVYLTSDHGHVAATGGGQPQEGVMVETRSKRARVYDNEHFAAEVQRQYPSTVLWHDDGLLPADRWVLLPLGRQAFASPGQRVVSHGGMTIEEMVVPLVTITSEGAP